MRCMISFSQPPRLPFDDGIQTNCEQEGMDVDVDCLLSGNDRELTDIPDFELEDNCQGNEDNSATVTPEISDVLLNPEMTLPVTSRELLTENILQKSRQL